MLYFYFLNKYGNISIMKKKIFGLMVCLFAFILCGCSVPPQYTIAQKSDGTVLQSIYIPFSAEELANVGLSLDKIASLSNEVKLEFDKNFSNMYNNFIVRVNTDPSLSDADKLYLINGCPKIEDMSGDGQLAGISYDFEFATAIHYYYFNMGMYYEELIQELNNDDSIVNEGFFTDKKINSGKSIFGVNTQYDSSKTLAQYISNYCYTVLKNQTTLTDEAINSVIPKTFIYRYGTPTKKLHSNADVVRYVNGVYYHEWNITLDDSEREVTTWQIIVNNNVWYAVALLGAIILAIVLLIIGYIKFKKEKKSIKKLNEIIIIDN